MPVEEVSVLVLRSTRVNPTCGAMLGGFVTELTLTMMVEPEVIVGVKVVLADSKVATIVSAVASVCYVRVTVAGQ